MFVSVFHSLFKLTKPKIYSVNNARQIISALFQQNWCLRCLSNSSKIEERSDTHNKIRKVLTEKQGKLRTTQQKLREKGDNLLADIKETKYKLKGKMEEIIERENIWTIPNILCVTRVIVSPYLGYLILQMNFETAIYVLAFAGITDLLDGYIARNFANQSSKLGSFLDPMADKVLIATMFVTLTYVDLMPVVLTSLIIARDVILAGAGFYIRYKSLPPPKTLSRYFDASHATAQLAPTFISKMNTLVQLGTVGVTLTAPVFQFVDHPFIFFLWWLTGATTIASSLSYIYAKNTYTLLKDNQNNNKVKS